MAKVLVI